MADIEFAERIANSLLQQGFVPAALNFKPFAERIADTLLRHGFGVGKNFRSDFIERNSGFTHDDKMLYRLEWWTTFTGSLASGFQLNVLMTPKEDGDRIQACRKDLNSIFLKYLFSIRIPLELAEAHPFLNSI